MRQFVAICALTAFACVGLVLNANNASAPLVADDTAPADVAASGIETGVASVEVAPVESVYIPLPTAAVPSVYIAPEVQQQIDGLTTRVTLLEATSIEPGRLETIEGQLSTVNEQLENVSTQLAALSPNLTDIQARLEALENPPEPVVLAPAAPDWSDSANPQYVLLFCSDTCNFCDRAKAEWIPWLEEQNWPVHVFENDAPEHEQFGTQTYPTWIVLEYGEEEARWTGITRSDMYAMMEHVATHGSVRTGISYTAQQAPISSSLKNWLAQNRSRVRNGQHWYISGSVKGHVMDHGWSSAQLADLTTDELYTLHDATHQGLISPSDFAAYREPETVVAQSQQSSYQQSYNSNCADGSCLSPRQQRRLQRHQGFFWHN